MIPLVLFVDDDRNVCNSIQRKLRKEPYDILTAHSAQKAMELLNNVKVNVVISDYNMPKQNGVEFLAAVKEHFPEIARMMITGEGSFNTAVQAVNEAHVSKFFTKPYNEIELGLAIRNAIKDSQGQKDFSEPQEAASRSELERSFPGISEIKRDSRGCILLNVSDSSFPSIIDEMEDEIRELNDDWISPLDTVDWRK